MIVFRNLFFYFFYIGAVFSQLLLEDNSGNFRAQEAMIFNDCNEDMGNIFIYDDQKIMYPRFFQQLHEKFHSIISYDKQNTILEKKVDAILITVSKIRRLRKIVTSIFKIAIWTELIPIYIVTIPSNNCDIVIDMMKYLWNYSVLTSYCFCIGNDDNIEITTYNPIAKRAPDDWTESSEFRNSRFYKRNYHPGTKCQELAFDRIKYFDGYNIIIGVPIYTEETPTLNSTYIDYSEFKQNESFIAKSDFEILNAFITRYNVTLKLQLFPMTEKSQGKTNLRSFPIMEGSGNATNVSRCGINDNELTIGLILIKGNKIALLSGNPCLSTVDSWRICDHLDHCYLVSSNFWTQTYPLAWRTIGIATYSRGFKSIGEKVWEFYGIWTILFTIFTLLVTFVVIWFSENKKTAFAVFEIIRLLISHNLHTRINTLSLRIFFISVFIYFLIIHATFSGHIAKFLTKPESRKHVETKEDLKALGYTNDRIYYAQNVTDKLAETFEEKIINIFEAKKCVNYILSKDSDAACVLDHPSLLYYAKRNEKLHVSKKPSNEQFDGFWLYRDWPLTRRIKYFFVLLEDFGLRKLWTDNDPIYGSIRNFTAIKSMQDSHFHPIKLENLMFSFWILVIGLGSATISFCVEMLMSKKSECILFFNNFLWEVKKSIARISDRINIIVRFFRDL